MKFLLDENIGKSITSFLIKAGHTVFRIKEIHPGLEDFKVLELAAEKEAVLITLDKDYGELVFKEGKPYPGIILLRIEDQRSSNVRNLLIWFLSIYSQDKIEKKFIVIIEKDGKFKIKFGRKI